MVEFVVEFAGGRIGGTPPLRPQIIQTQGREHQSAINKVARQRLVLVTGGTVCVIRKDRQRNLLLPPVAPDLQRDALAGLSQLKAQDRRDPITLVENLGVARDWRRSQSVKSHPPP